MAEPTLDLDGAPLPAGVGADREWARHAIDLLLGDARRSADTHLVKLRFKGLPGIPVYLKDESTHPTGSLKHRLARSLFLYGICNGRIGPGTTLVEASSGSTAVSEAYFAEMLGLPFVAVMPRSTSGQKIAAIERFGGTCRFVDHAGEIYAVAQRLADEAGGHYLDQFTNAERATDWRGNNNIAQSIFEQMEAEAEPVPEWVVMSAGTGGTSATIGRYLRYRNLATRLCVVDVEGSVFYDAWKSGNHGFTAPGSRIEGIGRPPRRAVVPPRSHRPHDPRARRRLDRGGARPLGAAVPPGRRLHRHELLRAPLDRRPNGARRPGGGPRHADLRQRRAVCVDLLR
jgi:cysteine synthase A